MCSGLLGQNILFKISSSMEGGTFKYVQGYSVKTFYSRFLLPWKGARLNVSKATRSKRFIQDIYPEMCP